MPRIFLGEVDNNNTGKPSLHVNDLRRHALTVASSGSGKGAGLIMNNCVYWEGSLVVVDPKGEAAEFTVGLRPHDNIAVLDPFGYANTPDHRARFNPLTLVRDDDDIRMITSGIVMRTGQESDTFWLDSAEEVIAGLIAFIMECAPPENKNLPELQGLINSLTNKEARANLIEGLNGCKEYSGLAVDAATRLSQDGATVRSIMNHVMTETSWIFSHKMAHFLKGDDNLDLRQLKQDELKLFLVLPPNRLDRYSSFLRLFVRCALSVMWEKSGSEQKGTPCLFLLDEFAALGRINEIRSGALQQGRSFGLHVWPFVISFGQLEDLYGRAGAQDFLASSDFFLAFGVQDDRTAELISRRIGNTTARDVEHQLKNAHLEIEREETRRRDQAYRDNTTINQRAEWEEQNRTLAEEKRYETELGEHKFWRALFGSWAGNPPVRRQIVRPKTALVTPQRPQELYANVERIRAQIGKPRMSPDDIRRHTAPRKRYGADISEYTYLETPNSSTFIKIVPHFAAISRFYDRGTNDQRSLGTWCAHTTRKTYRRNKLLPPPEPDPEAYEKWYTEQMNWVRDPHGHLDDDKG